jgi:hypothetical protein
MKLEYEKGHSYCGWPRKVGVELAQTHSMTGDHRHRIILIITFGYHYLRLTLNWGRRQYPEPRFKAGQQAKCWNDSETCRLKRGQVYEVKAVEFRSSDHKHSMMEEGLRLAFAPDVVYEATRFVRPDEPMLDEEPDDSDDDVGDLFE